MAMRGIVVVLMAVAEAHLELCRKRRRSRGIKRFLLIFGAAAWQGNLASRGEEAVVAALDHLLK